MKLTIIAAICLLDTFVFGEFLTTNASSLMVKALSKQELQMVSGYLRCGDEVIGKALTRLAPGSGAVEERAILASYPGCSFSTLYRL